MNNKRIYETIIKSEPLNKGFSENKKYCMTTADGRRYLLRILPISQYESCKALFNLHEQLAAFDVPICKPIEFGTCSVHLPAANAPSAADFFPLHDDGVYTIQSWIDGEDLKDVMQRLSESEQYVLGLKAGKKNPRMHSVVICSLEVCIFVIKMPIA